MVLRTVVNSVFFTCSKYFVLKRIQRSERVKEYIKLYKSANCNQDNIYLENTDQNSYMAHKEIFKASTSKLKEKTS